jgi:DNA polymerase elongation subunit (family B)
MRIINAYYTTIPSLQIHLVVQDEEGKHIERASLHHKPYFYSKRTLPEDPRITSREEVVAMNGTYWKYTVLTPSDVAQLRGIDSQGNIIDFEADVLYSKRYLYDLKYDLGKDKLRKAYIDIEVEIKDKSRFVNAEFDPIKSVSIVHGTKKIFIVVTGRLSTESDGNIILNEVQTEQQLLDNFFVYTQPYGCLVGWNLKEFDYEFIKIRSQRYGMQMKCNEYVWMDLMSLYKRFVTSYSKTTIATSFSLKNISQMELGESKIEMDLTNMGDIKKLAEYNIRDSELVERIDTKTKLTDLIDSIALTLNLLPDDCNWFSNAIEMSIMREMKGKYIFKCKYRTPVTTTNVEGTMTTKHEAGFEGAYVHEPPTGIFTNVATFDFASLYPNIIRTFNISPETITDQTENTITVPLGHHYRKDIVGVYNKFVTSLLNLRKEYKKKYEETHDETYNTLQIGTKFLISAFYGVCGNQNSRIYDPRLAASITSVGRYLIQSFEEVYNVIYGDTDSIMIPITTNGVDPISDYINEMEAKMNVHVADKLKQFNIGTSYMNIRFEKLFDRVYFYGKKKRYYGHIILDEEFETVDKTIARGLEIRRTDWCKLATEYEEELLKLLLYNIKAARLYHQQYVESIPSKSIVKFVIWKSLTRSIDSYKTPPPHVRAALSSDYVGTKIGYVVTAYMNGKIVKVERYQEGKSITPSYRYYKQKQIMPLYERLLEPLIGNQKKLL